MSGTQSALIGGGGVPVGATVQFAEGAANYLTLDGAEYLKQTALIPYSALYSAFLAGNPAKIVYGSATAQKGGALTGAQTVSSRYHYVNGKYVLIEAMGGRSYSTDLTTWTACSGIGSLSANYPRNSASSGSYIVNSLASSTQPLIYTSDGITFNSVGGSFSPFPQASAIAFGNGVWVSLSSLTGTAGEQAYIANVNPAGAWAVGASTNIGMTTANAIAYGNGVFVAVGVSASAGAGKIATSANPASGWVDRTAASGLSFSASYGAVDVVFDGSLFWLIGTCGLAKSSNGINWTVVTNCPISTAGITTYLLGLATDGAGRLVISTIPKATADLRLASTSDGGATWSAAQIYMGTPPVNQYNASLSYANGKFLEVHTGTGANPIDLGSLTGNPDYIGAQVTYVYSPTTQIPAHIRIK